MWQNCPLSGGLAPGSGGSRDGMVFSRRRLAGQTGIHEKLVEPGSITMHNTCMATKTISLEISAYEKLAKARLHEKESFSQVVMRGTWNHGTFSGRQLLNFLSDHKQKGAVLSEEDLDALEAAQIDPRVSDSKWNS